MTIQAQNQKLLSFMDSPVHSGSPKAHHKEMGQQEIEAYLNRYRMLLQRDCVASMQLDLINQE